MSDGLVIMPSNGDGYVELARTKTGRLFRKHLLNLGNLRHPNTGANITIDDAFVKTMTKNFRDGVCDIVQVPLANHKNEHSEDPERNIGEVVDLQVKDKKVYAVIDVRDDKHADKLGKTYLGASAMLHLDYTDTKTGKKVGPTLLHSCVTNRPFVTGLEPYEEIVAATTDRSEEAVVLLTDDVVEVETPTEEQKDMPEEKTTVETPQKPSLAELFDTLKAEHNIDVSALQSQAAQGTQAAQLTKTLAESLAKSGLVKLTGSEDETASTEDVVGAVAELANNNVKLSGRVEELEKRDAENAVQKLIESGHILPAKKATQVALKLSNPTLFDELLPSEPIVKLNNEAGKNQPEDQAHVKDVDAEIARLSALLK